MDAQVKVLQKGKITIPLEIRNRLAIREGDTLTLKIKGGQLILLPPKTVPKPTDLLSGLAEGVTISGSVKDDLRSATARRLEGKITRVLE